MIGYLGYYITVLRCKLHNYITKDKKSEFAFIFSLNYEYGFIWVCKKGNVAQALVLYMGHPY